MIAAIIAALVGGVALLVWIAGSSAPSSAPTPVPAKPTALVGATLSIPAGSSAPSPAPTTSPALVVATLGIPSEWPRTLSGFDWTYTTPVTDDDFALVNRHRENGVLTWLAKARRGVLLPDDCLGVTLGGNFAIVASFKQIVGNDNSSYGIIFRDSSDGEYIASLDEVSKYVSLQRFKDGAWTTLKRGSATTVVSGDVNTLVVKGTDTHYAFQVNDRIVLEADDDQLTGGHPGVFASLRNAGDDGTWEFSRFEVYSP